MRFSNKMMILCGEKSRTALSIKLLLVMHLSVSHWFVIIAGSTHNLLQYSRDVSPLHVTRLLAFCINDIMGLHCELWVVNEELRLTKNVPPL